MDIDEHSRDSMDMEDSEDVGEYISSGFTAEQRHENYMDIINNLTHLQTQKPITEDYMEENMFLIQRWRDWFGNFATVNPDVSSPDFRKACSDAETLLEYLSKTVRTTRTFDVKVYKILLQKMKYICDCLCQDDEIDTMMDTLSLK